MTFDVFPRRNLPDGAEPWGRAHDDRVLGLERDVQSLGQSLSGQNRNTASSLAVIAGQIEEITDLAQETNVLALTTASLAEGKLLPATASNGASGFVVNTSYPNVLSVAVTVPTGYTRAVVMLTGGVTTGTSSSGGDILRGRGAINSSIGQEMRALCTASTPAATVPVSHSAFLTGLTAGGSVTGVIAAKLDVGSTSGLIGSTGMISMTAIFLV